MASRFLSNNTPLALAALRIMSGLLFLAHGTQKFLSFPGGERAGSGLALDNPGAFAGIIELAAGALIALACSPARPPSSPRGPWPSPTFWPTPRRDLPGQQRRRRGHPVLLRLPVPDLLRPGRPQPGQRHRQAPRLIRRTIRPKKKAGPSRVPPFSSLAAPVFKGPGCRSHRPPERRRSRARGSSVRSGRGRRPRPRSSGPHRPWSGRPWWRPPPSYR